MYCRRPSQLMSEPVLRRTGIPGSGPSNRSLKSWSLPTTSASSAKNEPLPEAAGGAHPEKIRLIHRNYPMDHEFNPIVTEPFHVGSGRMALLAIHAAARGRFLEINDLLFNKAATGQQIRIAEIAEETGMDFRLLAGACSMSPIAGTC